MEPSPTLKPLALFLSFSGLIQGILWFILSVLALLTYKGLLEIPELTLAETLTHNDFIEQTIRHLYFTDSEFNLSVDRSTVAVFMSIYVSISIIWIIVSGLVFYFARFSHWLALKKCLILHGVVVIGVSALDITLMSMLIDDYKKTYDLMQNMGVSLPTTYGLLVIGMMFTLAARGYVLLIINIVCAVYSLTVFFTTFTEDEPNNDRRILYNMPIDAYKNYSGDVFVEAVNEEPIAKGWSHAQNNHGFIPDNWVTQPVTPTSPNVQRVFPESSWQQPQSFQEPQWSSHTAPQRVTERQPNHEHQEPLRREPITSQYALPISVVPKPPPPMPPPKPIKKIIKPEKPKGKKGPPIPFPDYTPPPSPTDLRPVIKPHSSYY